MNYAEKWERVVDYLMNQYGFDDQEARVASAEILELIEPQQNYFVDMTDPLR